MVARARTFLATKSPKRRNLHSYKTWLSNEKPLNKRENLYLEHGYDYVALAETQDSAPLDGAIQKIMDHCVPKKARLLHWTHEAQHHADSIAALSLRTSGVCAQEHR